MYEFPMNEKVVIERAVGHVCHAGQDLASSEMGNETMSQQYPIVRLVEGV